MHVLALIVLISGIGGANFYLAKRIHQCLAVFFTQLRFGYVLGALLLLTAVTVLGVAGSFFPNGIKHTVSAIGSYWMGIFIYLLLFTCLADLVVGVCRLVGGGFAAADMFKPVTYGVGILLAAITVVYGLVHAGQIKHVSYDISLNKEVGEMNVVVISDLHLGAVGSERKLAKAVEEINGLKPDLVCIAGDFFDTSFSSIQNPEKAIEQLKKLSATYGVYACLGNHDGGKTLNQMTAFLNRAGVVLLNDEYRIIDGRVILVGRPDASPIGGYGDMARAEYATVIAGVDQSLPVIVMDHNPVNIKEYGTDADLILCGHTHKGQIFPASLVTDMMYTVDYGYYRKDQSSPHVVVTSGVGTWGMPMRVGSDCEIVTIKFS